MIAAPPAEDGGRQFERTSFAWIRTGLSLAAVAMLLIREAGPRRPVVTVAGVVAIALGLAVTVLRREQVADRSRAAEPPRWQLAGLSLSVLILQLAAALVL